MQRLCSQQAVIMTRGISVSKPYLLGEIFRGYDLCSPATNLARDCTVPVRVNTAKLVSSSYHNDRGAELQTSDTRRSASYDISLASMKSHTVYTRQRPYQLERLPSGIYPTRNNSATKTQAPSQKKISSRWYSTGGPAIPGSDGVLTETSRYWDRLRILLEKAMGQSRRELAIAANQTSHITNRVQGYHEKEPGSRYIHGPHVHRSISGARTRVTRYIETIPCARQLIDWDQSKQEKLAEFEKELLRIDAALEECQERLRAREVEDARKRGGGKRQRDDFLPPFLISQSSRNAQPCTAKDGNGTYLKDVKMLLAGIPALWKVKTLELGLNPAFQALILVGCLLQVLAVFSTSAVSSYWQLFLAQGVAQGIGNGMLFTPCVTLVAIYFTELRVFALSIAACGAPIGGIIFPVTYRQLSNQIGPPWTIRVMGFIVLFNSALILSLGRPRSFKRTDGRSLNYPRSKNRFMLSSL
ncbi:alpha-L-arabinofuranosidase B [Apiospora sp. TS-2023a]